MRNEWISLESQSMLNGDFKLFFPVVRKEEVLTFIIRPK